MNMAQTKAMSSNHKQAIALCDKALPLIELLETEKEKSLPEETGSTSNRYYRVLFKYYLKRSITLKRDSSFRASYDTLKSLESRIRKHMLSLEKNSKEWHDS